MVARHQKDNTNYQECINCNEHTGRCEEDEFVCDACYESDHTDKSGPFCENCYDAHMEGHEGKAHKETMNNRCK